MAVRATEVMTRQEEEAKRAIERENGATVLKENQMAFQWPMVMLQAIPAVWISIYVLGFLATNTYLSVRPKSY